MKWIKVESRGKKPKYKRKGEGTAVLVYGQRPNWEPGTNENSVYQAFYGTRYTNSPSFYLFGQVIFPTHWMPMPEPPK